MIQKIIVTVILIVHYTFYTNLIQQCVHYKLRDSVLKLQNMPKRYLKKNQNKSIEDLLKIL